MKARIANYRGSFKTQNNLQVILLAEGVSTKDAAKKLLGKKVIWPNPRGRKLLGKVTNLHGNSGALRARFPDGVPGQAIGATVEII